MDKNWVQVSGFVFVNFRMGPCKGEVYFSVKLVDFAACGGAES